MKKYERFGEQRIHKVYVHGAIWRMLDEMNPGLEKLAEEPYERIREYELRTRELKEGDFKLG